MPKQTLEDDLKGQDTSYQVTIKRQTDYQSRIVELTVNNPRVIYNNIYLLIINTNGPITLSF